MKIIVNPKAFYGTNLGVPYSDKEASRARFYKHKGRMQRLQLVNFDHTKQRAN